ncbi:MAG: HRDC domain-containing protein [Bacteroidales bacterium]|nr:HRDC domain-containing protein [Bacteroidales bacterium]
MEMQIKIFNVPSTGGEQENEELNLFLRSHKILNVRDEFTPSLGWCFRVEYIDGAFPSPAPSKGSNEKEQYSKLSLEQKDIYSRLKQARTAISKQDAIPAYLVFTNVELMEIAVLPELSVQSVSNLNNVSKDRMSKYAERLLDTYTKIPNENVEKSNAFGG